MDRVDTVEQAASARPLDPDVHPWMRQPEETDAAFAAFTAYLNQEKRRVHDHGASSFRWSAEWSWRYRAYEYDLFMAQVDLEEQIRYRRAMNERHRAIARSAQGKLVEWLQQLNPQSMTAADATRLLAVVVEMERRATEGADLGYAPDPPSAPRGSSLTEKLAGLDIELQDLARLMHNRT